MISVEIKIDTAEMDFEHNCYEVRNTVKRSLEMIEQTKEYKQLCEVYWVKE